MTTASPLICSIEGCDTRLRRNNSTGRCQEHRYIGEGMGTCHADGCTTKLRKDNQDGFCTVHKSPTARAPERTCAAAGCEKRLRIDNRSGYCVDHANQSPLAAESRERYNAKLREETRRRPDERQRCSVDDCPNRLRSDNTTGRCTEHYYLPRDMPQCAVSGCENKLTTTNKLGRCTEHRGEYWAADAPRCAADGCKRTLNADNTIGYCREHRALSPTRKEYNREYYQHNQGALREYAALYRQVYTDEHRAASAAWALANPERKARNTRRSTLLIKYGLTVEQHEQMWADQRGVCALCEQPPKADSAGAAAVLHVDHDHVTGRVRTLLCKDCNNGLGDFFDDPELLRRAADYIEYFAASPTP
jgi:hypothetical protein